MIRILSEISRLREMSGYFCSYFAVCNTGAERNSSGDCQQCKTGFYKTDTGDGPCLSCSNDFREFSFTNDVGANSTSLCRK